MQKKKTAFTEEAEKVLKSEIAQFREELRELAIEEAKSRGEPVEVIVYDVKKALSKLVKREAQLPYRIDTITRIYLFIGLIIITAAIFYSFIEDVTSGRELIVLILGLGGLSFILASFFTRYLYRFMRESLIRSKARRKIEPQKNDKTKS